MSPQFPQFPQFARRAPEPDGDSGADGPGGGGEAAVDGGPDEVDASTAHRLVTEARAVLIDVREHDEWLAGHAREATHLPLGRLTCEQVESGRLVIVVCRSGGRSQRAAELLRHGGHEVRNLVGGMHAWLAAGLPVHRDDGSHGEIR